MLIYWSHFTDQLLTVTADIGDGFEREDLFFAANRVDEQHAQLEQMPHAWMRLVRLGIDVLEMPSMSVGDRYVLTSPKGWIVSSGEVDGVGWLPLENDTAYKLIARATREREAIENLGKETVS